MLEHDLAPKLMLEFNHICEVLKEHKLNLTLFFRVKPFLGDWYFIGLSSWNSLYQVLVALKEEGERLGEHMFLVSPQDALLSLGSVQASRVCATVIAH